VIGKTDTDGTGACSGCCEPQYNDLLTGTERPLVQERDTKGQRLARSGRFGGSGARPKTWCSRSIARSQFSLEQALLIR